MDTFLNKLLDYFKLSYEDYLSLTKPAVISDIPSVENYTNFERFIARIKQAIANNEAILVYGDYDADGVLATSILKYTFTKLGKQVSTMIPSRYKDGYGINSNVITKIANRGIKLLITVDNGILAHDAIDTANSLGMDVLVSDHHTIGDTLPSAYAIIHPDLSALPPLNSCGAYMALLISYGLLGYFDEYLITLAGTATVADMMELKAQNRTVVALALSFINKNQYYPLVKLNNGPYFDENTLGMKIAPKINALGRLSQNYEAGVLIEYFTTSDVRRINEIALYIEEVYAARREMSKEVSLDPEDESNPAIVVITTELEGVLGLIAQSYVSTYQKPAVVFCTSSEDSAFLKGSARSRNGFSLVDAFTSLNPYITKWGGHLEAAGLTLPKASFEAFKAGFNALAKDFPFREVTSQSIILSINELTIQNFLVVASLSPFGMGFEPPLFKIEGVNRSLLALSRDGKHILSPLPTGIKLVGFNFGAELGSKSQFSLSGTFQKSEYRGQLSYDFKIKNVQ